MLINRYILRRFSLIFALSLFLQILSFAQNLLQRRISFACTGCQPEDALLSIYRTHGISISHGSNIFEKCPPLNIDVTNETLENILLKITACRPCTYKEHDNSISLSTVEEKPIQVNLHIIGDSNEKLLGANITILQQGRKYYGFANEHGKATINALLPSDFTVIVSYPGYESFKQNYIRKSDCTLQIKLHPSVTMLNGVEIVGKLPGTISSVDQTGGQTISSQPGSITTALGGQADILRDLSNTPGVQTGVDGIGGIHIRGGNNDQNLILLDDVPVYNPSHMVGLLSIFNSSLNNKTRIWKGDFPARYGGRTSSVMDVRTRDGNNETFKGGLDLNGLMASGYLEGPTFRKKGSFIIGARHSLLNPWIQLGARRPNLLNIQFKDLNYKVYDLSFKINHTIGENDQLMFSAYAGNDQFFAPFSRTSFVENEGGYFDQFSLKSNWGNKILSLRWNRIWARNIFSNTTASYSNFIYRSQLHRETELIDPLGRPTPESNYTQLFLTDIKDLSLRSDFTYGILNRFKVQFGGGYTFHRFKPGALSINLNLPGQTNVLIDSVTAEFLKNTDLKASEWEGYVSTEYELLTDLHLTAGLNCSAFLIENTNFRAFLPRLRLFHGKKIGFSQWVSHTHMAQYLHQIGSFNIGLPFELWVPSTAKVSPERARQTTVGVGWSNKDWGVKLEAYEKNLDRIVVLLSVTDALITAGAGDASGWEDRVISGEGHSKGVELLLERKTGKVSGFACYTLSRSTRRFDDLNQGRPFLFQFDRLHDFKINLKYLFPKGRFTISATWLAMSGNPITLAGVKYKFQSPDNPTGKKEIRYFSKLNGYRLPPNHRLDVMVNFRHKHLIRSRPITHDLQLGAYNAYNRANPFYLVVDINSGKYNRAIQYTLLPVLPTFRYALTF